jgi:cytochrome c biogenesis protein CcdA
MYLGGVMALSIGYLILTFYNTWTKDWSVIITIVGCLAMIKGILILIRPEIIIALSKAMVQKEGILKIEAIAVIILGLAFAFLGFCPKSPI